MYELESVNPIVIVAEPGMSLEQLKTAVKFV